MTLPPQEWLIAPSNSGPLVTRVSADKVGWQHLNMVVLRLTREQPFELTIAQYEYVMVILSGRCNIKTSRGDYNEIGRRESVFTGMPYALYLPPNTEFKIEALTEQVEIAAAWTGVAQSRNPRMIRPQDVTLDIVGGGTATRQINTIVPPGDASQHLVVMEQYTPSGSWSTYPPHKHDAHSNDPNGKLAEANLEEISYFKFDRPNGYAIQRIYTLDEQIDETFVVYSDDTIVIPRGYHTLVSAHGYTTYSLHFLAGSARTVAASDDPAYAWVRQTWTQKDPRLPIVDHGMEPLS
ncbi:MAG: 5-deoxy-glucuronate isomerase [Anaerolineae bacterium]|nr:5-deoxy-glucuronate isomerase [Anaerolineae bacterium]